MKEGFLEYWNSLVDDIPHEFYLIALIIFTSSMAIFIGLKGFWRGTRYSMGVLLVEYIILIYCSTVFFRISGKTVQYDFMPFWSYQAYFAGREPNAIIENVMNVLVFVPVGLLLGFAIKKTSYVRMAIIGVCISVGVESLQLIFMKGFSEVDDVMHNTLGCILGYGLYRMIFWSVNK